MNPVERVQFYAETPAEDYGGKKFINYHIALLCYHGYTLPKGYELNMCELMYSTICMDIFWYPFETGTGLRGL